MGGRGREAERDPRTAPVGVDAVEGTLAVACLRFLATAEPQNFARGEPPSTPKKTKRGTPLVNSSPMRWGVLVMRDNFLYKRGKQRECNAAQNAKKTTLKA
jgi:hypothetical protein